MFILSELSDLVRIPPSSFHISTREAVVNELSKKFSNKVISDLGLAISIWDVLDIKEGLLRPGDGAAYVETRFRCVVWKPFVGEVLIGWVSDCTAEGIKVKLDFFYEIVIPKYYLFEKCSFREGEKAWVWEPEESMELFIDINEKIRFRVEEEIFANIKPKSEGEEETDSPPSYALLASCQSDGMGCVSWWE